LSLKTKSNFCAKERGPSYGRAKGGSQSCSHTALL